MRLLSRYLLRQLAAPFVFALVAQTSLMLLSQIAKKFGALVGKGLPWGVIAEVFALSLPFIIAMTLPMAVLLAVLYTFSHLAADNEITAMRASGISVYQVLAPVLAWGVLMAGFNFAFVDQVLPRTNARLRNLLIDIGRKKPTFELREQVINEVPPSQYFLRAGRIDPATGHLRDVTIYDVGGETVRRVIYADSGLMAYAEGQTDLSLRLFDGAIHQYRPREPQTFQVTYYKVNDIRVKNVFDELQRSTSEAVRGDREMSTCEMLTVIRDARRDGAEAREDRADLMQRDLRALLKLPQPAEPGFGPDSAAQPVYCHWLERAQEALLPKTAQAQAPAQQPVRQQPTIQQPVAQQPVTPQRSARPRLRVPPGLRPPKQGAQRPPFPKSGKFGKPAAAVEQPPPGAELTSWSEVLTTKDRAQDADRRAARFLVEVHKKWAISLACVSFVLIGIVMALRFPRGGIGLVIGGGLLVFSVHYVGLTAGESLADRGFATPWVAMWTPNIVLTIIGIIGLVRVSRESGSTRGGDFQELLESLRHRLRRLPGPWRRVRPSGGA